MKVKIIKTGKIEEYGSGYAVRLIEQGKAVPATAEDEKKDKAGSKTAGGK